MSAVVDVVEPRRAPDHSGATISIVLPVYNAAPYLTDAVRSVVLQTLASWELVIVDDGSTDGSGAIADALAAGDPRIRVLHQRNGGVSRARNAGLAATRATEAVIFLDADDVWESGVLERLSAELASRPDAVAVYGLPRQFETGRPPWPSSPERAYGRRRRAVRGRWRTEVATSAPAGYEVLCIWPCVITGGQMLIRRAAICYDEPFVPDIFSQDWLFWLRLSLRGELVPVDEFVIRKRERHDSLSRSPRFGQAELIVRRLLIDLPEMNSARVETARIGHRCAALERLTWASKDVRGGHPVKSAKNVRHAVLEFVKYARMRRTYMCRIAELAAAERSPSPWRAGQTSVVEGPSCC